MHISKASTADGSSQYL